MFASFHIMYNSCTELILFHLKVFIFIILCLVLIVDSGFYTYQTRLRDSARTHTISYWLTQVKGRGFKPAWCFLIGAACCWGFLLNQNTLRIILVPDELVFGYFQKLQRFWDLHSQQSPEFYNRLKSQISHFSMWTLMYCAAAMVWMDSCTYEQVFLLKWTGSAYIL